MSRPKDEYRTLRRRQAELANYLERGNQESRSGAPSFAGQVFNNGHMPNSLPGYFAVHPVTNFGGTESEGQSVSTSVNTSAFAIILVVGNQVPAVGDVLFADLISGRWIAERFGGTPTTTQNGCPCTPVPNVLNWSLTPSQWITNGCPSSTTLTVGPTPGYLFGTTVGGVTWISPSFTYVDSARGNATFTGALLYFCQAGGIQFGIWDTAGPGAASPSIMGSYPPNTNVVVRTCSPFLLKYNTVGFTAQATISG